MALLRRALVALGIAGIIAAVLRLRGSGRHPAPAGWLARARPLVTDQRMRALVIGAGAVGARAVRQLVGADEVGEVVVVDGDRLGRPRWSRARAAKAGGRGTGLDADVVLLAGPCGTHASPGRRPPGRGTAGGLHQRLDRGRPRSPRPRRRGPGARCRRRRRRLLLPGLLVRAGPTRGRRPSTRSTEVHVARSGTGGPACARQHHAALDRPGARLAGRRLAAPPGRVGPGAVLVPRPDRCRGLLPSRAPRCARCSCPPSRAWSGSRRAWPPRGATASPPTCPCCASRTPRGWSAPCGSRCAAAAAGRSRGAGARRPRPARGRGRRDGRPGGPVGGGGPGRRRGGRARRARPIRCPFLAELAGRGHQGGGVRGRLVTRRLDRSV